jgi:transporter family protein
MPNYQLILITILGWGVGSLFYKVANSNIHPVMVSAFVSALFVVLIPLSFIITKVDTTINTKGIVFALMGGLCMCVGSLAYFFALKRGGAGEITTVTAIYPAITLLLSVFFMKEDMTWQKGIGILLAIASVIVLSKK